MSKDTCFSSDKQLSPAEQCDAESNSVTPKRRWGCVAFFNREKDDQRLCPASLVHIFRHMTIKALMTHGPPYFRISAGVLLTSLSISGLVFFCK